MAQVLAVGEGVLAVGEWEGEEGRSDGGDMGMGGGMRRGDGGDDMEI